MGETVFFENGLGRLSLDISKECKSLTFILSVFQNNSGLDDPRVLLLRDGPGMPGQERQRDGQRLRENSDLCVAGLNELSSLRNIFREDQLGFYLVVVAGFLQSFQGRAPVRSMIGIGDGDSLNGWIEKRAPAEFERVGVCAGGRPKDDATDGVFVSRSGDGKSGGFEFLRVVAVGGEKEVEGGTVLDLREKVAAGTEGEIEFDAG